MKVGIVGAGKVGCALAIALNERGHTISGIYSESEASHNFLKSKLMLEVSNSLNQTIINSEIIFITTSDKVIKLIGERISKEVSEKDISGKVFFHCSGSLNSDEIKVLEDNGGYIGSLHPLQTFADKEKGWEGLKGIYFGFEGSDEAKVYAEEIVEILEGKLLLLNKDSKVLYHAIACILSNYVVSLSYMAEELSKNLGFDGEFGLQAFMPLIEKTINNIKVNNSVMSLTGPIVRGEVSIIEHHLEAINQKNSKFHDAYKVLGRLALEIATKRECLDNETIKELKSVLK